MSDRVRDLVLEAIRERGPITFATFMDTALYDPKEGFYARPPVGADGHFVTSPHVSRAFGDLLARQLGECWDILRHPGAFTVVEVGAGDGTLARQVLAAIQSVPELVEATRYLGMERTPGARKSLEDGGVEVAGEMPHDITGCVIANEVLDNLPFHRLRERDGRTLEVRVGAENGRLVEVEAEPSPEAIEALRSPLLPGEERPVSPEALAFVRSCARALERGYVFLFDYGVSPGERAGPVHAYREHAVLADVLDDPGSRDVTGAVDLGAVEDEARAAGLTVWGPVTQRDALLALGLRTWLSGVQRRQAEAEAAGDWRTANRLYAERSRATMLIDPDKLGALRLLVLGTEGLPPAAAVRAGNPPG